MPQPCHKDDVENHVDDAAAGDDEGGSAGIAHSAKQGGPHIEQEREHHCAKIAARIGYRLPHELLGRFHELKNLGDEDHTGDRHDKAQDQGDGHSGVDGTRKALVIVRAKELPRNDRAASSKADGEPDRELSQAHGRLDAAQRELAAKLAHDKRIDKGVRLLKERCEEDGNAKRYDLLPDNALRDVDRTNCPALTHASPPNTRCAPIPRRICSNVQKESTPPCFTAQGRNLDAVGRGL